MNDAVATPPSSPSSMHEALLYDGDGEYLSAISDFVQQALDADQPVLVEVPHPRVDLVRDALGADATRVRFGDMAEHGRNPGRIIPGVLRAFATAHPGRRAAIVGEPIWPGRSTEEYAAAVQHEALINLAFADQPVDILCPYDITRLPERAASDAERTHPVLRLYGTRKPSPGYTDPRVVVDAFNRLQAAPPPDAEVHRLSAAAYARQLVTSRAAQLGLSPTRTADLEIAISEVVGNSIVHAGDGAVLSMWTEDRRLVCEIRDPGHIANPLAGRVHPPSSQESGRGLLMVNHLCDLVQVRTDPSGTAIRLWMNLPGS